MRQIMTGWHGREVNPNVWEPYQTVNGVTLWRVRDVVLNLRVRALIQAMEIEPWKGPNAVERLVRKQENKITLRRMIRFSTGN